MTVLATRFPSRMHRETLPHFFHYIWKLKAFQCFSVLAFGDISAYLANRWSAKYERKRILPVSNFDVQGSRVAQAEASDLHLKPSKGPMGQLSQLNVGICAAAGILSWQSMPG